MVGCRSILKQSMNLPGDDFAFKKDIKKMLYYYIIT